MVEDFERLDTDELRHRAVELARKRWDVGYLWELVEHIPGAEAVAGRPEAGRVGATKASVLFSQLLAEREGDRQLREALRPLYLDYLRKHGGS
ncbi:hypothetical protein [Thermobifida cellulosilytica]|uniref:Uncharacterized protein n=1 Tax=Thermobifida cellulosilytica TB100 TaxID=665004 RepID=A0A147KG99_THECS|nr:hypothetical protein [Thermobifida cellulosilytica]KUP96300.1 hypothetical protein AC529_13070 [Thermobifida cellulosilytica TB100]